MEGIVKVHYPLSSLENGVELLNLLTETAIFPSKGEARKMIQNGGVSINREKVSDLQMQVTATQLLHEKYLLVQRGKKNYYLLIAVN
jgi:tyrosyl-tRNA synthetase